MKKSIEEKIKEIGSTLTTEEAILKLSGYIRQYCWNDVLRNTLGKLYLKQCDFVNAGKFLFLNSELEEQENRAVNRFKEKHKFKNLEIFRSLIAMSNNHSKPKLSDRTKNNLFSLIMNIAKQDGSIPEDVVRWIYNYEITRSIS